MHNPSAPLTQLLVFTPNNRKGDYWELGMLGQVWSSHSQKEQGLPAGNPSPRTPAQRPVTQGALSLGIFLVAVVLIVSEG